ncbi:MAG: aromatic aminobenezylarsenical efflux permease ArsG family transporter [Bryobacteraceae bacterium]
MTDGVLLAAGTALWLGVLTSVSPCPLATNIAAISWLAKGVRSPRLVFAAGALYTLGRAATYVALAFVLVSSLLSAPQLSEWLQTHINRWLGPILILVGMFLTGLVDFRFSTRLSSGKLEQQLQERGVWGAGFLGILFALSFCPVSAALYFGSLLPLALQQKSSLGLPALYGMGTGLPVLIFAWLLAAGARSVGAAFDRLSLLERYARPVTGVVFIAAGLYLSLVHIYGVQV